MSPIGLARAWFEYCRPTWQWRWTWKGSVWIAASRYYRPLLLLALLLSGCAKEPEWTVLHIPYDCKPLESVPLNRQVCIDGMLFVWDNDGTTRYLWTQIPEAAQ